MDKKVLFITVVDMYDANGNGGVKGSQRNLRLVQECFGEKNVTLATFPRKEYTTPPQGAVTFERTQNNLEHLVAALFGCKVYLPWKEKEVVDYIKEQGFDLIFIDSSMLGRLSSIKGDFKKVVFFHNVEADYAYNKVKNEGIQFLPSYWASKGNEKAAMRYADSVICLNRRDKENLKGLYGREADFILPITLADQFDLQNCQQSRTMKKRILFVGAYMPQNVVSVEWFINNVMTNIPDITLDIVGKGFEKKKTEYEKYKNVNVIGEVDDLGPYYYTHSIVVLPIQYGAGMKIKTAEAMMYGRIILASDEALEGYDVSSINNIVRCNIPEQYMQAIEDLTDTDMPKNYAEDVRGLYLEKYETSTMIKCFKNYMKELLG